MQSLVRIFLNTHMCYQHDGLKVLAQKESCNLDKLKDGEHVIFINRACDRMKFYSAGNVISYLRLDKGKIDLNTLSIIPNLFSETKDIRLSYSQALRKVLADGLVKRIKQ